MAKEGGVHRDARLLALVALCGTALWLIVADEPIAQLLTPDPANRLPSIILDVVVVVAISAVIGKVVRTLIGEARRAQAESEGRARELELHVAAGDAVLEAATEAELLDRFCRTLVDRGARAVWVGEALDTGQVQVIACAGDACGGVDGLQVRRGAPDPLAAGPTGRAIAERHAVVVEDVAVDPAVGPWRAELLAAGLQALAVVPLLAEGPPMGVLVVARAAPGALSADRAATLERIAADLARGLLALRRRAETDAENHRLVQVLEASPNPMLLVGPDGRIAFANRDTEAAFGWSAAEFVGMHVTSLVPLDVVDRHGALVSDYLRLPRIRHLGDNRPDLRARRRDGSEFPAVIALGPVMLAGVPHVVATIVDMTQTRALEEQLLQAQKMETMGQFANILAHDFRNYLVAIGGFADVVLVDLPADAPSREDVEQIRSAVDQAVEVVRNVLAFARPPDGEAASADVQTVITAAVPLVRRLVGPRVRVETGPMGKLPPASIQPTLLGQVLLNLATNARAAMPNGGSLVLDARELDSGVEVSVRDSGIGMQPEVMNRLFEPFFTTRAGDPEHRGTGLGLTSVRVIVERAGGRVSVTSAPGAGSTFRVLLPRAGRADRLSGLGQDVLHGGAQVVPGERLVQEA